MSIPVGYFSWRDRWTYSDDKERLPYQVGPLPHQVASTVAPKEAEKEAKDLAVTQKARSNAATAPAKGIPSVPINVTPTPETLKPQQPAKLSRYVHPNDRPMSIYQDSFRVHPKSAFAERAVVRPDSEHYADKNLSHEERSFRMHSRVNPSFFVQPFETDSSANLVDHKKYHTPTRPIDNNAFAGNLVIDK